MATADQREAMRIVGRLCSGPTDLAAAFPHGGTALGMVTRATFRVGLRRRVHLGLEYGNEPIEVTRGGQTAVLGVLIRGYDNDMWSRIFTGTTAGAETGKTVAAYPGSNRAGRLGSDDAVTLLYSPRDTEKHPALIIYRAVPLLEETAEMRFSMNEEFGVPGLFLGLRNASGSVWRMGRLEDLALT